jgi:hypothetical protein
VAENKKKRRRLLVAAGVAALIAATAAGIVAANKAEAAPSTVTASTHITNRPDSGNGGTWAYDNFKRTLTVTVAASQAGVTAGDTAYTATVSDSGHFSALVGADTPNQVMAGAKIEHSASGSMNGGITYTVTAPSADALTGTVAATENDNFSTTGAGFTSTGNWPKLAFASAAGVTVTEGNAWSWKYATACESWTDAASNGDGNLVNDGNITGMRCIFPFTYDGRPSYVAPTRENITFKENIGTWVEFIIHGPGAINSHHGWVRAQGGGAVNTGVYSGLEPGHEYGVTFNPVTGQGSSIPIPGSHGGTAVFVS